MLTSLLLAASLYVPAVPPHYRIYPVVAQGFHIEWRLGISGEFDIINCQPGDPLPCPQDLAGAGANLPITDPVAGRQGTARYIDPAGSDAAACTVGAPCLTLGRAQTVASNGDNIVVHGGTYLTQGNTWSGSAWSSETTISKNLYIAAYPNETPIFDGATESKASFTTTEGSYKYMTYVDRPCSDAPGASITFCTTGSNLTGGLGTAGANADQVWVNNVEIQQVMTKAAVAANKFYVDAANNRLYMLTSDVNAATTIHVSNLGDWLKISATNVTLRGLIAKRYSNAGGQSSMLDLLNTADNFTLSDVEIDDTAMLTVSLLGDNANLLSGVTLSHVTIDGSNWMGIASTYAVDAVVDASKLVRMDRWNEWTDSPQSGAIKTGRNKHFTLTNSQITDNREPGIWMDQSNWDRNTIANNIIKYNISAGGACVFFEISDSLYLINNWIDCTGGKNALKFSGSSELIAWNNTLVGGSYDAVGIYADGRSSTTLHCSDPDFAKCGSTAFNSDRWCPGKQATSFNNTCSGALSTPAAPNTLDWMPRVSVLKNNIIMNPHATGLCSSTTALCYLAKNTSGVTTDSTMQSIIHPAEGARSLPETAIDCNVYANGTSRIISRQDTAVTHYTSATIGTWKSYTAGAPISIAGIDANSLADPTGSTYVNTDGTPTAALTALHSSACAAPTDAIINAFVPAGTKHFGYLPN